jgi:hypothetical protein
MKDQVHKGGREALPHDDKEGEKEPQTQDRCHSRWSHLIASRFDRFALLTAYHAVAVLSSGRITVALLIFFVWIIYPKNPSERNNPQ